MNSKKNSQSSSCSNRFNAYHYYTWRCLSWGFQEFSQQRQALEMGETLEVEFANTVT